MCFSKFPWECNDLFFITKISLVSVGTFGSEQVHVVVRL